MRSVRSHLLRSKKGLERLEGMLDHEVSLALFFVFRCSGTLLRSVGSVVLCLGAGQLATRQEQLLGLYPVLWFSPVCAVATFFCCVLVLILRGLGTWS